MQKDHWLSFLSDRIKSQISLENAEKAQTWGLAVLSLWSFGIAVNGITGDVGPSYTFVLKALFLTFWNLILLLGVYLPSRLQKGEKTLTRFFHIRDFTSQVFINLSLCFTSLVVSVLGYQMVMSMAEIRVSGLFAFTAWVSFIVSDVYFGAFVFYFMSLLFFPKALVKMMEKTDKAGRFFLWIHAGLFICWMISYGQLVTIGSGTFFDQLRHVGLFWIASVSAVLYLGRFLEGSSSPALVALHLEIASGRLERSDDILQRYKEAFMLRRLFYWIKRLSHHTATRAHEVASFLHEAVAIISEKKPTETQIAQVEDRYRKANAIYHKLEKDHQRFLLNISFFDLLDIEREKIEDLKDQFSKELRHAKLELSSVRKRIDDKLVAMKEGDKSVETISSSAAVQELPVTH